MRPVTAGPGRGDYGGAPRHARSGLAASDRPGSGSAACGACDGRRLVVAAGHVEFCAGCGGEAPFRDARRRDTGQGEDPGTRPSPGAPLRRAKMAALGLALVLVGWPTLLLIDFALQVFLAYVI